MRTQREAERPGSQRALREQNLERVIDALVQESPASLVALGERSKLARGTVHAAVNGELQPLLATRDIRSRTKGGPGGKATRYFSLKPYVALGVDFDHDRVRAGLVNLRGHLLWHGRKDVHAEPQTGRSNAITGSVDLQPEAALAVAVELAREGIAHVCETKEVWDDEATEFVEDHRNPWPRLDTSSVLGLGVAMAAPVEPESGAPSGRVLPAWNNDEEHVLVRPAQELKARLGLRDQVALLVDNDANLGAWAEYRHATTTGGYGFRPDEPPKSLLYVKTSLGTSGIGAGMVFDGQIYRGANFAGELGHVLLDGTLQIDGDAWQPYPIPCPHCGRDTCLQARTDVRSLLPRDERGQLRTDTWEQVVERLSGEHKTRDPRDARDSDEARAVRYAGRWLGRALGNAATLLNPDLIVIGGPLMEGLVHLLSEGSAPSLRPEFRATALHVALETITRDGTPEEPGALRQSELAEWAVAIGAADRAREEITRFALQSAIDAGGTNDEPHFETAAVG